MMPNTGIVPLIEHTTDAGRFYETPSGIRYPSVTTILAEHSREGIEAWKTRVGLEEANRVSLRASTWGTKFHALMEQHLSGTPIDLGALDKTERRNVKTFFPLLKRITEVKFQEVPLYSDTLRTAGRVDLIASFDDIPCIIDFKTSGKPKVVSYIENYLMQATAYSIMAKERLGLTIKELAILICVDQAKPQIFRCKPTHYIKDLLYYRDLYEKTHNLKY